MQKLLTVPLAFALALVAITAVQAAVVTRSTIHSEFTFPNPCTGEDVFVSGDVMFLTTSTVTDNTISGTFHSVFINVVAPGPDNNLYSPIFFHTTVNANGEVTAARVDFPPPSCH